MKTVRVLYKSSLQTELTEGERLECKIERMTENSEPIGETAPLIYTPRKDGVIAAYDVRTDKWDIALDAMSKVNKTRSQIVNLGGMNEAKKAVADGTIEAQELN